MNPTYLKIEYLTEIDSLILDFQQYEIEKIEYAFYITLTQEESLYLRLKHPMTITFDGGNYKIGIYNLLNDLRPPVMP